ncbi:MAG: VWA domain-containing protein [Planctomycetes bacterium]|nr:VWA domain-containing protein [Planctomycetota bacterium]
MKMLSTYFAHPALLAALAAIPVAMALLLYAYWRKLELIEQLGSASHLRKSILVDWTLRRWRALCVLVALTLVAIAGAGPQWGIDKSAQFRKGRDVILVLDLSRSMSAEQPSRRELAVRSLRRLADTFEEQGGNRVALVLFAAVPHLAFPLTQDYDHLRHVLSRIEAGDIPRLTVDDPVSGTRTGAGIKLAVDACDPRRTNRPMIVLLSDGDDPAGDDEWRLGIAAAKEKKIRVHTVGLGDPNKDEKIPHGREFLSFEEKAVLTRLREEPLREIARATDGVYIPARTDVLPLGTLIQHLLDVDEMRDEAAIGEELPTYHLRFAWFLLPAVMLLMVAMGLNEGPSSKEAETPIAGPRSSVVRSRAAVVALAFVAVVCVSATGPPDPEELVRQGNEAYAKKDYAGAIKLYEQSEAESPDPGLISFNKAAAHYRLGQHKDAIDCYRRSLEDDAAPPERRARANFDLGNALVQFGDDVNTLADAVAAYRACLKQPGNLRADARHNLDLAQQLWYKAWQKLPEALKQPRNADKPNYPDPEKKDDGEFVEVKKEKGMKPQESADVPKGKKSKTLSSETLQHLPDKDKVSPAALDVTLAALEREARRIAAARREQRSPSGPANLSKKDW